MTTTTIRKGLAVALLPLLFATLVSIPVRAQQTTERFIPIGFSPGVSNISSHIGAVTAVDNATQRFSIEAGSAVLTLRVTPDTRIWLDRSRARKTNVDADFGDILPGRRIEVHYDGDDPGAAVWIKIEAS